MKNKRTIAIISALTGVCVLSTAAFANYMTPNGYDELKQSAISTLDYKNASYSLAASVIIDGNELGTTSIERKVDAFNNLSFEKTSTTYQGEDDFTQEQYIQGNDYYYTCDGKVLTHYTVAGEPYVSSLWGFDDADKDTAKKVIHFLELMSDTVVGDLRNNFICTDENDECISYSITLDSVQIPEIINAGLSAFFSVTGLDQTDEASSTEDPLTNTIAEFGNNPTVDNFKMDYTINKDGSFNKGNVVVVFTGGGHNIEFNTYLSLYDIGTTTVQFDKDNYEISETDY